jgi:hypothetical protein
MIEILEEKINNEIYLMPKTLSEPRAYPLSITLLDPLAYPADDNFFQIDGGETFLFFSKKELMALKKEINKVLKKYENI